MKVVNRIEIASGMEFSKIVQIMVSEPLAYPFRDGYSYVHVLCFTSSSNTMALLLPYIYAPWLRQQFSEESDTTDILASKKQELDSFQNNLQEWLLINEQQHRSRHSIHEYHAIG